MFGQQWRIINKYVVSFSMACYLNESNLGAILGHDDDDDDDDDVVRSRQPIVDLRKLLLDPLPPDRRAQLGVGKTYNKYSTIPSSPFEFSRHGVLYTSTTSCFSHCSCNIDDIYQQNTCTSPSNSPNTFGARDLFGFPTRQLQKQPETAFSRQHPLATQ
jgi:hypothetical protein